MALREFSQPFKFKDQGNSQVPLNPNKLIFLNSNMESDVTTLKMNLLLSIQLNKYDEAGAFAQKILAVAPDDPLINKFSNFLQKHKSDSTLRLI